MTEAVRAEVVRRYEGGETSREVAEGTELAKSTVLAILKRDGVKLRPQGKHYT